MKAEYFVGTVSALQLCAAVVYAWKRRWPEAVMMFGAAIANAGTLLLGEKR